MVTIIGIVTFIIVAIAFATSAILGQILQTNLDAKLRSTATETAQSLLRQFPPTGEELTAQDVLDQGWQERGTVLVLQSSSLNTTGAFVAEPGDVRELSADQLQEVVDAFTAPGPSPVSISISALGSYRVTGVPSQSYYAVVGVSLGEVQSTVAQIITTVALVTAGGLLLLAATIAFVVRSGLRPLRSVADTAERVATMPLDQGEVTITERVPDAETDDRTEIGRVGLALNTLLDHVGTSLDARQRNEERMRRFVADASHELRTPLASIRGYSELSLRDRSLSETTESSLERIQAQSLRMTSLVEDLLLLARLDEGQELVYGSVDLSRLSIEAVGDAQAAGLDHEWVLELDDEPVVVAGDSGRLTQVLANLLANARVHTPEGTTVTVSVAHEADEAVVRVHDDGPGIDPDLADELFERFARADRSRARKTGGTGLGLSIARAIAEAHDGSLSVVSEPGDTTFELRLPAVKPAQPAAS
ncbi:sensor histidine kinase [Microbacterium sp.]|uniref:sensor histidine kinase n=1 Tax=Microbacterium sp. TaxID=51671 RepID=UPI003F709D7F